MLTTKLRRHTSHFIEIKLKQIERVIDDYGEIAYLSQPINPEFARLFEDMKVRYFQLNTAPRDEEYIENVRNLYALAESIRYSVKIIYI
jgi:hypothetical protein